MYWPAARVAAVLFAAVVEFLWKVVEREETLMWQEGVWDVPNVIGDDGVNWFVMFKDAWVIVRLKD